MDRVSVFKLRDPVFDCQQITVMPGGELNIKCFCGTTVYRKKYQLASQGFSQGITGWQLTINECECYWNPKVLPNTLVKLSTTIQNNMRENDLRVLIAVTGGFLNILSSTVA